MTDTEPTDQEPASVGSDSTFISAEQQVVLQNRVCVYCLRSFERGKRTREHVIGRCFVPRGIMRSSWNLLVYACHACNNEKSRLEDEISAISMQADCYGRHPEGNETLMQEGERKGRRSRSSLTKRPVSESLSSASGSFSPAPGVKAAFHFEGPPQIGEDRVALLASYHMRALFFWLTYNEELRRGSGLPSRLNVLPTARRSDWGNAQHVAFMHLVDAWKPLFLTDDAIAGGFFKIALRRHPSGACWAWALEWNMQFRTIGFFGDSSVMDPIVAGLPALTVRAVAGDRETGVGYRREVPLDPKDDHLFAIPLSDDSGVAE